MSKHVETLMALAGYAMPETRAKLRKAAIRLEAAEKQLDIARKALSKFEKTTRIDSTVATQALVEMTTINRQAATRR